MADKNPPDKTKKPPKPRKPLRKKFERKLAAEMAAAIASGARVLEACPPKESASTDKVAYCTHLMVTGEWNGYSTRAALCSAWGCVDETVRRFAAEAHRRLELDADLLGQQRIAHAVFCDRVQRDALAMRNNITGLPDFGSALRATELAARFRGIEIDNRKVELTGKGGGPVLLSLEDLEMAIAVGEANTVDDAAAKPEAIPSETDPIDR